MPHRRRPPAPIAFLIVALIATLAGCALFEDPPEPPSESVQDTGIFNNGELDGGEDVADAAPDSTPDGEPDVAEDSPDVETDAACAAADLNACGGCGPLGGAPDDVCGPCGGGRLRCEGTRLACVGATAPTTFHRDADGDGHGLTDDVLDACEPAGLYTASEGGDCNDGRSDIHPDAEEVCDNVDNDCNSEVDESARNACGGCAVLDHEPQTTCGTCGMGRWTCAGENTVRCEGTSVNECGGCNDLPNVIGSACGACGDWTCDGEDATRCNDPGANVCGGCEALVGELGQACGECGEQVCDGTDALRCDDPGRNACGGCQPLPNAPGESCATVGVWRCVEQDALSCLPRRPVVDSGTRVCSTLHSDELACPIAGAEGQDGDFAIFPPRYERVADAVIDHVTGLRWQRDHSAAVTFASAAAQCPTGYRLPSRLELASLHDYGRHPPVVPQETFTVDWFGPFWTDTAGTAPDRQWVAEVVLGMVYLAPRTSTAAVRCVSGERLSPSLTVEGDVVRDATSGLMWQRTVDTIAGDSRDGDTITWLQMLQTCTDLVLGGFDDWRLPTLKELLTLVDEGAAPPAPAIDTSLFVNTRADENTLHFFWSSTFGIDNPVSVWGIHFDTGETNNGHDGSGAGQIRCVRNIALQ